MDKAQALVEELRAALPACRTKLRAVGGDAATLADEVAHAQLLLNGTPLGMWPHANGIPVPPEALHPALTVFDPVYNPTPTRLVLNTRKAGGKAHGGLGMLVHQAIAAQQIWNPERTIDAATVAAEVQPPLANGLLHSHPVKIMLIGFMGCGKSTVGKHLAARLGLPFTDLDDEIVKTAGCPIPEIFAKQGEAGFRALETQVCRDVLARPGSEIIAAGGGLAESETNRALIRETNTLVLGIEAPFETLWARIGNKGGRPLAAEEEAARARYERRAPIYHAFCDFAVATDNTHDPATVAAKLAAALRP